MEKEGANLTLLVREIAAIINVIDVNDIMKALPEPVEGSKDASTGSASR